MKISLLTRKHRRRCLDLSTSRLGLTLTSGDKCGEDPRLVEKGLTKNIGELTGTRAAVSLFQGVVCVVGFLESPGLCLHCGLPRQSPFSAAVKGHPFRRGREILVIDVKRRVKNRARETSEVDEKCELLIVPIREWYFRRDTSICFIYCSNMRNRNCGFVRRVPRFFIGDAKDV